MQIIVIFKKVKDYCIRKRKYLVSLQSSGIPWSESDWVSSWEMLFGSTVKASSFSSSSHTTTVRWNSSKSSPLSRSKKFDGTRPLRPSSNSPTKKPSCHKNFNLHSFNLCLVYLPHQHHSKPRRNLRHLKTVHFHSYRLMIARWDRRCI